MHAPAFGTIQRKSSLLTPVATMKTEANDPAKDEYDAVVGALVTYMDDTKVPEHNYGRRLRGLELISSKIQTWEAKEGSVDEEIGWKLWRHVTDTKRPLLKQLRDTIKTEKTKVEDDGLASAKIAHAEDRKKLTEYLTEAGTSTERALKNTADWFKLGKADLYALTPTGDSEARIEKGNMDMDKDEAWFPTGRKGAKGHILDDAVEYNPRSLTDNTNVILDPDGKFTGGWNVTGLVAITSPAKKQKEKVWETLRHEVQHDADFNEGRDTGVGVREAGKEFDATGAGLTPNSSGTFDFTGSESQRTQGHAAYLKHQAEIALTLYKTEYRAYSYQEGETNGPYSRLDNSVQNQPHDGKNFTERQLAIFKHVYRGYEHTSTNWDANSPLAGGRTFRDEVVKYWNPDTEAFNKYNSPRVDDFYRALDAIGIKEAATKLQPVNEGRDTAQVESGKEIDDLKDPGVVKLLEAIDKLDGYDGDYIINESPAMIKKIDKHLKGAALAKVKELLQDLADFSKLGNITLWD